MPKKIEATTHSLIVLIVLISVQIFCLFPGSMAVTPPERWDYRQGNWTYIEKLGFPVNITRNHIGIGKNWTYVFNLDNDSQYHVYFYGKWIGTTTDYDIFVYDPDGNMETYHTASFGLMEHLGTTVEHPLFNPKKDGNYSILIVNDLKDSGGAEAGTLMVIEHLDANRRYKDKLYMVGKDPATEQPRYYTTWVYEFNSSSRRTEISVDVPETLDMYEVRLYLMANPASKLGEYLLGMPIAWEQGLYNKTTQSVGGYNTNFTAYRGNIFDSCEYRGEDMFINYTSPSTGNLLYHLVLIAEWAYGNISFVIKTDFTKPYLNVSKPDRAYAEKATTITAIANDTGSGIDFVNMSYSINNGASWNSTLMTQSQHQTYTGSIPGQPLGTTVLYRVEAQDYAENEVTDEGSYKCVGNSTISLTLNASQITGGASMRVEGSVLPARANANVSIQYVSPTGSTINQTTKTDAHGNFSDTYTPQASGSWTVKASWEGDQDYLGSSNTTQLTVSKIQQTLQMSISKEKIALGESLAISGLLSPALPNATINLIATDPESQQTITKVQTTSQGTFTHDLKPDLAGPWIIMAVFEGDVFHSLASSKTLSFEVAEAGGLGFLNWQTLVIIAVVVAVIVVVTMGIRRARRQPLE